MIQGHDISLHYKKKKILSSVNFMIPKGRATAFIGKSGSGKTTLLKCISGIYPQTARLEGKIEKKGRLGFVSQYYDLFPHMTVLQNCTHPLETVLKWPRNRALAAATDALKSLEMLECQNALPTQLSGGQQQRVAIARSMGMKPETLLLDEPTAALDPVNTKRLISLIQALKEKGIAVALSSHDVAFLRALLDLVYFVEKGQVVECFDLLSEKPQPTPKIAEFLDLPLDAHPKK